MTVYPYSHRHVWKHAEGDALKCNPYNEFFSGDSLTVDILNDSLDNRRIALMTDIAFIKRLDPEILLP